MPEKDDLNVFPLVVKDGECMVAKGGLTLRDLLACQALPGVVSRYDNRSPEEIAQYCYRMADAMLKERAKK